MTDIYAKRPRSRSRDKPTRWRGAPGKRCYAIGDIHGRLDLLRDLLRRIETHSAMRPARPTYVVTLGDVIDRGPASREVVEFLMRPLPFAAELVCLKGNHEDMLLRGMRGEPTILPHWLDVGGLECAQSYGINPMTLSGQPHEVVEHNLAQAVPREHLAFLDSFADSARFGSYLLVHAGVRPGIPFAQQASKDLRWIRRPFLESSANHGFMVVHGHSVSLEVESKPNRIGIDTGAYKNGLLTAMWIEDDQHGFLQASDSRLV